jgi:hypothetical protein
MNKQPLQSFKSKELVIIHKATFYWTAESKKQQLTVCGDFNAQDARQVKSSDWDQVNCKRCLRLKDDAPMSTMSL